MLVYSVLFGGRLNFSSCETEISVGENFRVASGEKRAWFGGDDPGDTGWKYTCALWSREGGDDEADSEEKLRREKTRARNVKKCI